GVHLILDEIMCGSGRTGTYFAHRHEGIVPDMVALAKGLASGYQPIGALLCKGEITDAIRAGSGFFQHGHTFMGHVTAVAAALATFKVVKGENLLENVNLRGESIRAGLRETIGDHPNVGDVRGRGLFIGVEFVADKQTRAPLDPADGVHKKVQQAALERGLMVYGMGGTIDGCCGNHVLIAPAFTINESHEAELIDKFSAAISDIMPSS
ncbi:MAG: aminotransferase class III-fold pyridoxal phosphate-dependent enzyme, partial [Woeseiaceae bacterium]